MVTDLPQSFLLLGDINPKCRVLINSFANRRGERRRWLINNYGRGTIHISLNKRVIQGGWVEDEPESRARETYPADKSSLIRVRDLYRPSVNWILKCRWWGLGDCGAVCRAKRPHIVTTTLQYSKALLYTRRFCSHATRVGSHQVCSMSATIFLVTVPATFECVAVLSWLIPPPTSPPLAGCSFPIYIIKL